MCFTPFYFYFFGFLARTAKNIPKRKKQKTEAPSGAGFCFCLGMFSLPGAEKPKTENHCE